MVSGCGKKVEDQLGALAEMSADTLSTFCVDFQRNSIGIDDTLWQYKYR